MNRKNEASFFDEAIKKDNTILPQFCSEFGQHHTIKPNPNEPDKVLTKYSTINLNKIRAMIDGHRVASYVLLAGEAANG